MRETTKSHPVRLRRGDYDLYLHGRGIDIGAGDDPLRVPNGTVDYWDQLQGDAQALEGLAGGIFDFVYSSHCLEHMRDVNVALWNWGRVLRPGGFAYLLVPDFTLYEQHRWPSVYNLDHKQSFSLWLGRDRVRRDNHWHLASPEFQTVLQNAGLDMVECELQDDGYDYNLGGSDQTLGNALAQILMVLKRTVS